MKAALWLVLALGTIVNAFGGMLFDGALEIAVSVTTGIAVIGSITALVLTREKQS